MDRIHWGRGSRRKGCLISEMTHGLRQGLGAPTGLLTKESLVCLARKGVSGVLGQRLAHNWWESERGEHVETVCADSDSGGTVVQGSREIRRKLQEIGVQRRILFLVFGWERDEHAWMLRELGQEQRLKK